jgi:hypothetical protein
MDPTHSIVWTRKSFIGSLVPCRVGFLQNLVKNQATALMITVVWKVLSIEIDLNLSDEQIANATPS